MTSKREHSRPSPLFLQGLGVVVVVALVALFAHRAGSDYEHRKKMLTFDESVYARLGMQMKLGQPYTTRAIYKDALRGGRKLPDYVNDPMFKHPPLYAFLVSLVYTVLPEKSSYSYGELHNAAVFVSNFFGALLIVLVYIIAARMFNPWTGLLAAMLIAVDLNRWITSERVWIATTLVFFSWAALGLLWRSLRQPAGFYAAGMLTGIALLAKYPAVLVLVIFLSYVVIARRDLLKNPHLYGWMAVSALVFFPWIRTNLDVYGADTIRQIIFSQTGTRSRLTNFGVLAAALAGIWIALLALWVWVNPRREGVWIRERWRWLAAAGLAGVSLLFWCRPEVWASVGASLSWSGLPEAGWKIGMYDQEPWTFYLRQHIEYAPFYLFALIGLITLPWGTRADLYLTLAAFWVMAFGILYGNPQGRYVLMASPALMILAARAVERLFFLLRSIRHPWNHAGLSVLALAVAYSLAKGIVVVYRVGYLDNVAYF